jgi:hypothetical protein
MRFIADPDIVAPPPAVHTPVSADPGAPARPRRGRILALLLGIVVGAASLTVGPVAAAYAGTAAVACTATVGIATTDHNWRADIVACAQRNLGVAEWGTNCDAYTQALYGNACASSNGWCSDFVKWVWLNSLHLQSDFVDAGNVKETAASVETWAKMSTHLTWKSTDTPVIGDAVVFGGAGHTGIVIGVSGTTITMIGGNVGNVVHQDTISGVINTSFGGEPLLGYASPDASWSNPFGNYESASGGSGTASVKGWVIDGDGSGPIPVDVYADGRMIGRYNANVVRSDVGAAYPTFGSDHGFAVTFAIGVGPHSVCVYGINYNGTGTTNPQLGCRSVSVA